MMDHMPADPPEPRPWGAAATTTDLSELLRAAATGDETAFADLYDATSARLYGLVLRVVRDPAQAEEVTQEAFLDVWRASARFDPAAGSAMGWMLTIAHRKAVDRVRSAQAATDREDHYGARTQDRSFDATAEQAESEPRRPAGPAGARHADRHPARRRRARLPGRLHPHRGRHPPGGAPRHGQDTNQGRLDPSPRHPGDAAMSADVHGLSGAYAVDALDERERVAFERHLAECAECQAEVASLRAAATELAGLTEVAPPPELRDAVLEQIRTVRPLPPTTPATASETPAAGDDVVVPMRRRRMLAWLGAAAAAVIVAIGGLVWSPWSDTTPPTVAERVLQAADAQRYTQQVDGARATIVRSPSVGRAVLVAEHMPSAPAGKDFQLWLQEPGQGMVSAGLMPHSSARVRHRRPRGRRRDRDGRGDHPRAVGWIDPTDDAAARAVLLRLNVARTGSARHPPVPSGCRSGSLALRARRRREPMWVTAWGPVLPHLQLTGAHVPSRRPRRTGARRAPPAGRARTSGRGRRPRGACRARRAGAAAHPRRLARPGRRHPPGRRRGGRGAGASPRPCRHPTRRPSRATRP